MYTTFAAWNVIANGRNRQKKRKLTTTKPSKNKEAVIDNLTGGGSILFRDISNF